jgi:transcriptional regulator with XRE-family HTH domain
VYLRDKIKVARKFLGLNQEQMAALCHVNRSTYANWETSGITPSTSVLQVLSDKTGVSIDNFVRDEDDLVIKDGNLIVKSPTIPALGTIVNEPPMAYTNSKELQELRQKVSEYKAQIEVLKQVIIELKKA